MVDSDKYMKQWRLKEIKQYIFQVMEDATLKDNDDDWWRFKQRVVDFNQTRKRLLYSSRILVFDESMSAYMPRSVFCFLRF